MKKRNKIIAFMMGTVLTLSMTGTAMAASTSAKTQQTAQIQKTTAGSNSTTAKDKTEDKTDTKMSTNVFYGRVKSIGKNSLEIETAVTEDAAKAAGAESAANKTSAKTETAKADEKKDTKKAGTKGDEKTVEEPTEFVLDGLSMTASITKDTVFLQETKDETDGKTTVKADTKEDKEANAKTNTKEEKKANTKTDGKADAAKTIKTERIKLDDLKAGDFVKITIQDGEKITEITVLTSVKVVEEKKDAAKADDKKN